MLRRALLVIIALVALLVVYGVIQIGDIDFLDPYIPDFGQAPPQTEIIGESQGEGIPVEQQEGATEGTQPPAEGTGGTTQPGVGGAAQGAQPANGAAAQPAEPQESLVSRFLTWLSSEPPNDRAIPNRHGLGLVLLLPLLLVGIPWLMLEYFVVRYVQPIGIDLATVLAKARDGLFIQAVVSVTARKRLSIASMRASWPRVRSFVEKEVEQELVHAAIQYDSLEDLERNIKTITDSFLELPVVRDLQRDFGIQVMRFNIEVRYPSETRDALNRKADASAGGIAYQAYARAAHLNPDGVEARELYKVFQQTTSQVDAARNLGDGLSGLASSLGYAGRRTMIDDDPRKRPDESTDKQ